MHSFCVFSSTRTWWTALKAASRKIAVRGHNWESTEKEPIPREIKKSITNNHLNVTIKYIIVFFIKYKESSQTVLYRRNTMGTRDRCLAAQLFPDWYFASMAPEYGVPIRSEQYTKCTTRSYRFHLIRPSPTRCPSPLVALVEKVLLRLSKTIRTRCGDPEPTFGFVIPDISEDFGHSVNPHTHERYKWARILYFIRRRWCQSFIPT